MAEFVRVASVDDIPPGTVKAFEIRHTRFVLIRSNDRFYAMADECTHDSAPIADGVLRGPELQCIRHGARFDLATGAVKAPPAVVPLDTYEVKVEGKEIYVRLE